MAKDRNTMAKRQREVEKRRKAEEKRDRRERKKLEAKQPTGSDESAQNPPGEGPLP